MGVLVYCYSKQYEDFLIFCVSGFREVRYETTVLVFIRRSQSGSQSNRIKRTFSGTHSNFIEINPYIYFSTRTDSNSPKNGAKFHFELSTGKIESLQHLIQFELNKQLSLMRFDLRVTQFHLTRARVR